MSGPAGEAEAILGRVEQSSGRPLRAMIEISDRCNEVCVHCYQVQGQKGEMTTAQIKAVMDELAELGVLILTISGGEATLRKDFLELLAHARSRGFAIRLFTNGLTMTRELARALADLAVHVVEVSVYSHRADVHDFVTGVAGSHERSLAGVRHLVAAGVDVHIKTPMMSVNEDDLDAYVALAGSLGVTYAFDPHHMMPNELGDRAPEMWSRSAEANKRAVTDPRLNEGRRPFAPREQRPLTATLCGAGEGIHVEPNGELRPCTMLPLALGDAKAGVRAAREQGDTWRALLALRWSDVHGCRDCDLRAYCHRCHASSLAEAGDALAPYASACAGARTKYELSVAAVPRVNAPPGRDAALGPYRKTGEHEFVAIDDEVTPADDALAARLGWVRREKTYPAPQAVRARGGELLQIRRPGHRRAQLERVPLSREPETYDLPDRP
jgi:radical SAM protein with 4Fe4S-binding SPASM domain